MRQQQTTLPNGLRIVSTEMPDSRSVAASIVVGAGSRYETFARNGGVSHFLEHLLFKGTTNYPTAEAISLAVDAVGGMNNAYTSQDVTNYYIKVPARHRELPLKILAEMVSAPLFDPVEIDRERGVIVEEMHVYRDDPARYVSMLVPDMLYPGNPLGHDTLGSEKIIREISRDEIKGYMEKMYRPHNLVVAVSGRVHHDEVVAQAAELLGHLQDDKVPTFKPLTGGIDSKKCVTHQKDTTQAHFIIAARSFAYGTREEAVTRVITAILGRGMSSRLLLNVRERQGLAYSVMADASSYVDTGMIEVYAGVNLEKANQALDSVLHELRLIGQEPVEAIELNKAKEQLCAELEMSLESNMNIAERTGVQLLLHDEIKPIDEAVAEIQSVTPDEVMTVAAKILAPELLRLAIIAPQPQVIADHFEKTVTGRK